MKIGIRAKIKKTGKFVNCEMEVDEIIYKTDNDSLYGIVSDYLDDNYGRIFKWFRFWKIKNESK